MVVAAIAAEPTPLLNPAWNQMGFSTFLSNAEAVSVRVGGRKNAETRVILWLIVGISTNVCRISTMQHRWLEMGAPTF